jgi:mRNA interferase RelE/StbE
MYKITFSKDADKTLRRMPRNLSLKIVQKIKHLARNPQTMRNVKKLTDHPGYRLRIGDWRIVYTVNDNELFIHVIKIKSRGEVYK